MKPKLSTAAILGMFLIAGCKKDATPPNNVPEPEKPAARIAIKLNTDYLTAAQIDSATLLWEAEGASQTAGMTLSNDTLFAETKHLAKGAGRVTIQVFSNIKLRHKSLQWEKRADLTLEQQSVNWNAPANYEDAGWNPRVILIDPNTRLTAIIALRPTDPYFLLKNIPTGFKIELERNYTRIPGGAEIVAGGTWKCNTACTDARGIIENREFFIPLAARIEGREWKMVETGVGLFGPNGTSGGVLYFNHF